MRRGSEPEIAGAPAWWYAALVAAGVLSFQDAVLLVHKRAAYMQGYVSVGEGAMAALLVSTMRQSSLFVTKQALRGCSGCQLQLSCQTVIAGTAKGVETAVQYLQEKGRRRRLFCRSPHRSTRRRWSPLQRNPAAESTRWSRIDAAFLVVVSNYTGGLQQTAAEIREPRRMGGSPRALDCVCKYHADFGADTYVECGPGKTLCGVQQGIDKGLKSLNVENLESPSKKHLTH